MISTFSKGKNKIFFFFLEQNLKVYQFTYMSLLSKLYANKVLLSRSLAYSCVFGPAKAKTQVLSDFLR